ncbi:hypothetical protein FM036_28655, partial [Nostoc sp. HG1]|nr:hypothetical protein [Nostoc sp. HG1]
TVRKRRPKAYPFNDQTPARIHERQIANCLNPQPFRLFLVPFDSEMTFLYKSDWRDADLRNSRQNQTVTVQHHNDRRATVRIDLPPSGMAILA